MKILSQVLTLAFAATCFVSSGFVHADVKDPATGIAFPEKVSFEESGETYSLDLTGIATRKKFFIKVYSIAHYMQNPEKGNFDTVLNEVFDDSRAKQFTMTWARPVDSGKIKSAYDEAFKKDLSEKDYATLQPQIDEFLNYFNQESKRGESYLLRWAPGGKLSVIINGKTVGQIENVDFAKAVWNIWFRGNDVVKRQDLVQKIVN